MCIASRAYSCGFIEHLPIANRHNRVGPKPKSTDSFYAYNIASASRTPCDCRYMYTVEPSPHPCAVCRSMGDPALDLVGHNGHALRAVPQQQQSEAVTTAAGPSNTTAQPLTAGTILSGLANNAAAHSRNTSTSSFDPYAQIVGPLDAFVLTNGLNEGYIDNETHQSVWLANRAATTGPLLADAAHHGDDVRADTTLELTDQNGRTRAQLIARARQVRIDVEQNAYDQGYHQGVQAGRLEVQQQALQYMETMRQLAVQMVEAGRRQAIDEAWRVVRGGN